ncbi:MAG: glycosyltransferase [Firmicutes bacterium]|nr:glycosyltransferase [Bacillota bacterium]
MGKAAFLVPLGEGHVNPALALAQELGRRGHAVAFYADQAFRSRIERSGASFRPLASLIHAPSAFDWLQHPHLISRAKIQERLVDWVMAVADALLHRLGQDQPDYLVCDSAVGLLGAVVARRLQIPHIGLCTTFAWTAGMPPIFPAADDRPAAGRGEPGGYEEFASRYGFWPPEFPEGWFSLAEVTLVLTSRLFQPDSEQFDQRFHFIGPCIGERFEAGDFPLQTLDRQRVLYISLGTLFNHKPAFYQRCVEAFSDFPGVVVMAIGRRTDPETLPAVPRHFILRPYVPQPAVLQRAAAFLSHGGMNSVNESLYHHVPLLLYPIFGDQPVVARRVVELGAGLCLSPDPSVEEMRDRLQTLLANPGYRAQAARIGASLRAAGGCTHGADVIERYARTAPLQMH